MYDFSGKHKQTCKRGSNDELQKDESMLTFEAAPCQGTAAIIEKLQVGSKNKTEWKCYTNSRRLFRLHKSSTRLQLSMRNRVIRVEASLSLLAARYW